MKRIGVVYGMETTFPPALVDKINSLQVPGIVAEHVKIGAIRMDERCPYRVIIDRISHDIPFYRAWLKNAVLDGATVVNDPFWWSADDKFFNYALAHRLGVAVPRTVILPHKHHPPGTTDQSMRNLTYPLDWQQVFHYIGFPAFLKPHSGGGWKHVYKVHTPEEFFEAYNDTGDLCMTLQQAIEFDDYFRCYVVGQTRVHVMRYNPRRPHAERYVLDAPSVESELQARIVRDSLTLCRALGYDLNTVEFAVENGVPYAIDFLNPAPDADIHSVGEENFAWIVNAVAEMAVAKAVEESHPVDYHWARAVAEHDAGQ